VRLRFRGSGCRVFFTADAQAWLRSTLENSS
jgi:hypothetical protein